MRKAVIYVLISIAALFGMVACGTTSTSTPTVTSSSSSTATNEVATKSNEATTTKSTANEATSNDSEKACFDVMKVAIATGDDSDVMPK